MKISLSLSSDDELLFPGYRKEKPYGTGFERGNPEQYSSIEHFYQSEKFRGVSEEHRQYILSLPTAREARKAAKKLQAFIRPDWELIRNRVMYAGISLKLAEHDRYAQALLANPDIANGAYGFKDHYWGDIREGVSAGFYRRLLISYRDRRQAGLMRVLVTGSPSFQNSELFNAKLRSLFRNRMPDELLINCDRGTDSLAEQWAINNYIPVRHFPLRGSQSKTERARRASEVLALTTHAIVFWQGISPRIGELLTEVRRRKIQLRLFKIDASGNLIQPPPTRGRPRGS